MPDKIKKSTININHGNAIVSNHVKDYSQDPVFVKETEAAKAVLEKYGFPASKEKIDL